MRRALEAEVARAEEQELGEELESVAASIKGKFMAQELARDVRETRDKR